MKKSVILTILFMIALGAFLYFFLSPTFNMYFSDDDNCIEISVAYERGTISPSNNFTKEFWLSDKLVLQDGSSFRVYYITIDSKVRLRALTQMYDLATGKEIEYLDLEKGVSHKIRANNNVVTITVKNIFPKEKPRQEFTLPDYSLPELNP